MNKWEKQKAAIAIALCCSLWVMMFPELTLPENTVRIWQEESIDGQDCFVEVSKEHYFDDLLQADFGEIRLRSRLWEWICEYLEKD